MTSLTESLEALTTVIRTKGFPIDTFLQPRLSLRDIHARTSDLPFHLPEQLVELYQWHDGTLPDCPLALFRDEQFLPLEDALLEYATAFAPAAADDVDWGVDLRECFPFAGFEGSYYVLPAGSQTLVPQFPRPVICVFEGIDAYFLSLTRMVETFTACFETGVYSVSAGVVDEQGEREIWAAYNPGLI